MFGLLLLAAGTVPQDYGYHRDDCRRYGTYSPYPSYSYGYSPYYFSGPYYSRPYYSTPYYYRPSFGYPRYSTPRYYAPSYSPKSYGHRSSPSYRGSWRGAR